MVITPDFGSSNVGSIPAGTTINAPLVEFGRHSGFRLQCEVIVV